MEMVDLVMPETMIASTIRLVNGAKEAIMGTAAETNGQERLVPRYAVHIIIWAGYLAGEDSLQR